MCIYIYIHIYIYIYVFAVSIICRPCCLAREDPPAFRRASVFEAFVAAGFNWSVRRQKRRKGREQLCPDIEPQVGLAAKPVGQHSGGLFGVDGGDQKETKRSAKKREAL